MTLATSQNPKTFREQIGPEQARQFMKDPDNATYALFYREPGAYDEDAQPN